MFRTIMAVVAFGLTLPAIASAQGAAASPVRQRSASGTGNLYERGEKGVESGEGEEAGFPIPVPKPERLKDGRHFVVFGKAAFYSSPKGERGQKLKPGRYELTDGRVLEVKRDGVAALTIHMPIPLPKPVRRRR